MTSVLPAWKQELIEKKRRKEKEIQAEEVETKQKIASVPEWKRSILEKKRKEATRTQTVDEESKNYGAFVPKVLARKSSQSGQQGLGIDSEKISNWSNAVDSYRSPVKRLDDPKEDFETRHSGVTTGERSRSLQQQQKQDKYGTTKLPNNTDVKHSTSIDNTQVGTDLDVKVAYEHVRPPSELRKLFDGSGNKKSSDSSSLNSRSVASSTNIQASIGRVQNGLSSSDTTITAEESMQNTSTKRVSSPSFSAMPYRGFSGTALMRDQIKSQTESVTITNENTLERVNSNTQFKDENSVDSIHFTSQHKNSINDTGIPAGEALKSVHLYNELDLETSIVDEQISPIPHVEDLRSKFGTMGKFHRKSSSVENLLISTDGSDSSVAMRSGPKRRPVLTKRWTADLSTLMSPPRSFDDENDDLPHDLDQGLLRRQRSISMHDLGQDGSSNLHFRHRASISHDIERRVHELLRQVSHSESHTDDDEYLDVKSSEDDFLSMSGGIPPPPMFETKEEQKKLRTASWTEEETAIVDEECNQNLMAKWSVHPQKTRDLDTYVKAQEVIIVEKEEDRILDDVLVTSFKEPEEFKTPVHKQNTYKYASHNGDITSQDKTAINIKHAVQREEVVEEKPSKGSVHTLSALFGSTILKGSNKDKNKEKKHENKAKKDQEMQNTKVKEEGKSKKNEENKSDRSSKLFPWSKNKVMKPDNNKVINLNSTEPRELPFKGINSLRHVETKHIEQKISGQMTLVLDTDANTYTPKRKSHYESNKKALQNGQENVIFKPTQPVLKKGKEPKGVPVTPIDIPIPMVTSFKGTEFITTIGVPTTDDVEVSAIDMPEPPKSPAPVSVIDMPSADDVSVSVIDVPDEFRDGDEEDETDSDDSEGDVQSGSYDVTIGTHPLILSFGQRNNKDSSISDIPEEEEEEEDIDDVPVSYFGDSTYMTVPKIIFDKPPERMKPCLSSPMIRRKKERVKVKFPPENLHKVHDYPSEECLASHYDQYLRENGGKSLANYKPSTIESYEETLKLLQQKRTGQEKENKKGVSFEQKKSVPEVTSITYTDEGDGFTSSSSSTGALLF